MKVIAFNGSARKQGNTAILINHVFSELEKEGIETELVELAGKKIQGCTACYKCFETKDRKCAVKNEGSDGTCGIYRNGGMFKRKAGAAVVAGEGEARYMLLTQSIISSTSIR